MPPVFVEFLIGTLLLLPFFFLASLNHDRLVRLLYEKHRADWDQARGPVGFFWRPPTGILTTSLPAFMKSSMTWAFRLPAPLAADPAAKRPLLLLRIGLVTWNVGMLSLFALIVHRHGFPPRD